MKSYVNVLKNSDIFYNLTDGQLEIVSNLCQQRSFTTEEIIFHEGSNCDELYIIQDGVVDILVNLDLVSDKQDIEHEPEIIAKLRRGQSFGEIALVDQGLRSATARSAQDNTRLLIIPSSQLLSYCKKHPDLGFRLMFNLAADLALKIRRTTLRIREEFLYGNNQK
jgi:CRP-like cAMP-binding protein